MSLLAFDTSTEVLSVALTYAGQTWVHEEPGGAAASAALIPAIQTLLTQANVTLQQLDAIVFGSGPGSFTGLRTACSVAQGLALGSGLPVLGLSTLLATAEQARFEHGVTRIVAVLDARMQEVYTAAFDFNEASHSLITSQVRALAPAEVTLPEGYCWAGNFSRADLPCLAARPTAAALLRLAPAFMELATAPEHAAPLYVRDKVAQTVEERRAQA